MKVQPQGKHEKRCKPTSWACGRFCILRKICSRWLGCSVTSIQYFGRISFVSWECASLSIKRLIWAEIFYNSKFGLRKDVDFSRVCHKELNPGPEDWHSNNIWFMTLIYEAMIYWVYCDYSLLELPSSNLIEYMKIFQPNSAPTSVIRLSLSQCWKNYSFCYDFSFDRIDTISFVLFCPLVSNVHGKSANLSSGGISINYSLFNISHGRF